MLIKLEGIIKYECVIVNYVTTFIFNNLRDDKTLQIGGFRHSQQHGMIRGLTSSFQHPKWSAQVSGRFHQHLGEVGFAHMVGTRTVDEDSSRSQHLKSAEVELFVAAHRSFEVSLAPGESR